MNVLLVIAIVTRPVQTCPIVSTVAVTLASMVMEPTVKVYA